MKILALDSSGLVAIAAGMLITAFAGGIVYFDNKDII